MPIVETWYREARERKVQPNPDSLVLASATPDGAPSARVVLCKKLIVAPGYLVFFTNYDSRKGHELAANPRVAGVFHWVARSRQVRTQLFSMRAPSSTERATVVLGTCSQAVTPAANTAIRTLVNIRGW